MRVESSIHHGKNEGRVSEIRPLFREQPIGVYYEKQPEQSGAFNFNLILSPSCSQQRCSLFFPIFCRSCPHHPRMTWCGSILDQLSLIAGTSMGVGIILPSVCLLEFPLFSLLTSLKGDVWWLDRASAFRENLAYVDQQNRVIMKVDNVANIPFNEKRNSVIVTLVVSVRSTWQ